MVGWNLSREGLCPLLEGSTVGLGVLRRVRTPTNLRRDSGPAVESGLQYQPRESLYDTPSLQRHLDDGDSECGDDESGAPPGSLSFTSESPLSPCTPLSSSSVHNRRQSESYSSEIVATATTSIA